MSNNKRNQIIHAILAAQPLCVDESARFTSRQLRDLTNVGLLTVSSRIIKAYDDYMSSLVFKDEKIEKYSKLKQSIEWLALLSK